MRTSESVLQLIKSKKQNKTIKTGNWKATKNDDLISVYYYGTLVALYPISIKNLVLVYDYSVSTKCGLTKIKNELAQHNLIDKLFYTDRKFKALNEIKL